MSTPLIKLTAPESKIIEVFILAGEVEAMARDIASSLGTWRAAEILRKIADGGEISAEAYVKRAVRPDIPPRSILDVIAHIEDIASWSAVDAILRGTALKLKTW